MWYLGHGLTKVATAVIFVIAGAIVATVIGVILRKIGYDSNLLFGWIYETIALALNGPTTIDQGRRALSQSDTQQLDDRIRASVGAVSIVVLLWTLGKAIGWLGMGWRRREDIVAKKMWPVILVCMGVAGFGYYSWSEQWKEDRASEVAFENLQRTIQERQQEMDKMQNIREGLQKEQERVQKEYEGLQKEQELIQKQLQESPRIMGPSKRQRPETKRAHKRAP